MKKIVIPVVLVGILVSGCSLFGGQKKIAVKYPNQESQAFTIIISKDKFAPSNLEINVNDKVVFFNEDDKVHQISVGSQGGIPLEKGASWTFPFVTSGKYPIQDVLNPAIKGEIVVK